MKESISVLPSQHPEGSHGWAADHARRTIASDVWDRLALQTHGVRFTPVAEDPTMTTRTAEIYEFTDRHWNGRGSEFERLAAKRQGERGEAYRERQDAATKEALKQYDSPDYPHRELILEAGAEFNMIEGQSLGLRQLTNRMVLGGATRACIQRTQLSMGFKVSRHNPGELPVMEMDPRYAHLTPEDMASLWGPVLSAGSTRPLGAAERALVDSILPDKLKSRRVLTEADVMFASARYALSQFGEVEVGRLERVKNVGYDEAGISTKRHLTVGSLEATTYKVAGLRESHRPRADTGECNQAIRNNVPHLFKDGKAFAVVTNSIFVPFQEQSAMNHITAQTGAVPKMVSYGSEDGTGEPRKPAAVLQEFNSAARQVYDIILPELAVELR